MLVTLSSLLLVAFTSIVRPPHHGRRERNSARLAAPIQSRSGPLQIVAYAQVADDIQQWITEGEIELKLPSERSFAEPRSTRSPTPPCGTRWRYCRTGGIITVHGRGTFVTPHERGTTQTRDVRGTDLQHARDPGAVVR